MEEGWAKRVHANHITNLQAPVHNNSYHQWETEASSDKNLPSLRGLSDIFIRN